MGFRISGVGLRCNDRGGKPRPSVGLLRLEDVLFLSEGACLEPEKGCQYSGDPISSCNRSGRRAGLASSHGGPNRPPCCRCRTARRAQREFDHQTLERSGVHTSPLVVLL